MIRNQRLPDDLWTTLYLLRNRVFDGSFCLEVALSRA